MSSNEPEVSVAFASLAVSDAVLAELERVSLQEISGSAIRAMLQNLKNGLIQLDNECFKIFSLIVILREMTVL